MFHKAVSGKHENKEFFVSEQLSNEEVIRARRRQRIEEMQRSKERQLRRRKYLKMILPAAAGVFAIVILITAAVTLVGQQGTKKQKEEQQLPETGKVTEYADGEKISDQNSSEAETFSGQTSVQTEGRGKETGAAPEAALPVASAPEETAPAYKAEATENTLYLSDEVVSNYALLIDLDSDSILAQKSAKQIINPASMTKILTVLVAAEHVTDLDDTFTMTLEITDYSFVNDCSNAGFLDGEVVTVRDLFYGTVLPSGGDAAVGLATYVAGSQEEFVKLMNDKLKELGLSGTAHVTNCVGLYDEDHYCTVYDMAMILEAAIENEFCREVLSAHTYTTSVTEQHPEGILLSNWFLRRIEDKDTGGVVMCGKTGYVVESGNCAASYAIDHAGKGYICVTADSTSSWRCIYDHVALYKQFATGDGDETLSASGNVENG